MVLKVRAIEAYISNIVFKIDINAIFPKYLIFKHCNAPDCILDATQESKTKDLWGINVH